jgi:hypothetical protein
MIPLEGEYMRCSVPPFLYGEDSGLAGYQRIAAIVKAQRSTADWRRAMAMTSKG